MYHFESITCYFDVRKRGSKLNGALNQCFLLLIHSTTAKIINILGGYKSKKIKKYVTGFLFANPNAISLIRVL